MSRAWQLVVEDPSCLSGRAVSEMIREVASTVGARFVGVDEVEGRGVVRLELVSPDLLFFSVEEVANVAEKMLQFEWGDFFLVRTKEEAEEVRSENACQSRVLKSLVAIRCVDNTYFYVYGTDPSIRDAVRGRLRVSEEKEGLISELDYPR